MPPCTQEYYLSCVHALIRATKEQFDETDMANVRAECLSIIPAQYDWGTWCTFTLQTQFHTVFFDIYDALLRTVCGSGRCEASELKLCVMRACATEEQMVSILKTFALRIQFISNNVTCWKQAGRMTNALNSLMAKIESRASSSVARVCDILTGAEQAFTGEILHERTSSLFYDGLSDWTHS